MAVSARGKPVIEPRTRVERRCDLLLRLAADEDRRGHPGEARDLLAAAECEARRSDRDDLLVEVRRACLHPGTPDRRRRVGRLALA